jgi:hypothetical protein
MSALLLTLLPQADDDEEMDFIFDEEVSVRPGSKAPLKHSSGPQRCVVFW